jgi:UDP-glucose 4-epimerase
VKIVVTGATGFIGRALCRAIVERGDEAVPLDLRIGSLTGGDAVVHLAGIAHGRAQREELERVNVRLAKQVGEAAAVLGVPIVHLSSVKVHGETSQVPLREDSPVTPADAYARSKAKAEEVLRAIPGLRLAVLRPPLVYGPGVRGNFLCLLRAVALGIPLPLASVRNRRSFLYVGNLVDAIVRCLGERGTYLVSDGSSRSTAELCRDVGEALGRPAKLFPFRPAWLPEKLTGALEVDDSAIRARLGWRPPYTAKEGLRATADWYRRR